MAALSLVLALVAVAVVFSVRSAERAYIGTTWAYAVGRQGSEVSQQEVGSIAELPHSRDFAEAVHRLDTAVSVNGVRRALSVEQPSGTTLVEIDAARAQSPAARRLSLAALQVLSYRSRVVWSNLTLQALGTTSVRKASPGKSDLAIASAAILAAVLASWRLFTAAGARPPERSPAAGAQAR